MKKNFKIVIILLPLLLFSCFEFVGTGTAKQTLQLALAAPGDVAKLHIGVFDGVVSPETVILTKILDPNSNIPMDLPAGNNRIIVIWAQGFSGTANYYGYTPPINISDDNSTPVPIRMISFSSPQGFNLSETTNIMNWTVIPGALVYEIQYLINLGAGSVWVPLATTTSTTYDSSTTPTYQHRVKVYSSLFGLSSDPSPSI